MKVAFENGGRAVAVGAMLVVAVAVLTGVLVCVGVLEGVGVCEGVTDCRVTSIQRFLGHKELSSTMVYARAHDQTLAEDYFAAMQRVEERLDIMPELKKKKEDEVVKVQEPTKLFQRIQHLELPELCLEERLSVVSQLYEILRIGQENAPLREIAYSYSR